jgi:hypothetical protein
MIIITNANSDGAINCLPQPNNFIMTPNARPLIGTLQKRMPTRTWTATNQTCRAVRYNSEFTAQLELSLLKTP